MLNNKPLISVCLLSYNLDHFIAKVIDSIIDQNFKDFEFIISDDSSTDKSWEILKSYYEKYNFIKIFRQDKNIGMAKNANFCFSMSKGKYIALLSHDDIINKYLFEKWLEVMEKDENISFVFNDFLSNGIANHRNEKMNFNEIMDGNKFLRHHLLKHWGSPIRLGAFIRKSCLNEIGGMDERFGMLADVDLWMRLSAKWKVGYVAEPLIEINRVWKEDYPKEYTSFSWSTIFLLFEIHSINLSRTYGDNILVKDIFRLKVNFQIIKWLSYSIVKKRKDIMSAYSLQKNSYEMFVTKLYYIVVKYIFNKIL